MEILGRSMSTEQLDKTRYQVFEQVKSVPMWGMQIRPLCSAICYVGDCVREAADRIVGASKLAYQEEEHRKAREVS